MWRKKKSLSFLPRWEFQTPISLGTPRLPINLPRNWLSHGDDMDSLSLIFFCSAPHPQDSLNDYIFGIRSKNTFKLYVFSHEQPFLKAMRPEPTVMDGRERSPKREKGRNLYLKILFGHIFYLHGGSSLLMYFRLSDSVTGFLMSSPAPMEWEGMLLTTSGCSSFDLAQLWS